MNKKRVRRQGRNRQSAGKSNSKELAKIVRKTVYNRLDGKSNGNNSDPAGGSRCCCVEERKKYRTTGIERLLNFIVLAGRCQDFFWRPAEKTAAGSGGSLEGMSAGFLPRLKAISALFPVDKSSSTAQE